MALLALMGGWVGGRAATWEPVVPTLAATTHAQGETAGSGMIAAPLQSLPGYGEIPSNPADLPAVIPPPPAFAMRYALMPAPQGGYAAPSSPAKVSGLPHLRKDFADFETLPRFYAPEVPAGRSIPLAPGTPVAPPRQRRLSMDAWALMRRDSAAGAASVGAMPGVYGASQAGGILRYRLAMASRHRPIIYLRSTSSTGRIRETTAALGLSARPIASVPVVAALEGRMTDQMGRRIIQGAAMAITELPAFPLFAGLRGEAYGQAGYVAGGYSTFFADGQFRADRALVSLGRADVRIGGGVWGGAQKGAERLDAGPSATLAMPLGSRINGRIAVDWRFRLAGDAQPGSGPALTLSAGF
ncbi:hypothetical protein [Novosphingobium guangzhouense]|nr:hypothetical protein [Novosphingobium guangzhouense]